MRRGFARIVKYVCILWSFMFVYTPAFGDAGQDKHVFSINPVEYGLSTDAADNSKAMKLAIAEGASTGLPVYIPSSTNPYRISGDIVLEGDHAMLAGIGGNVHLEFDVCSLIIGEL